MKIVDLPKGSLEGDAYGSRGIAMTNIAEFGADTDARVHIGWRNPNSVLGRHRTGRLHGRIGLSIIARTGC